MLGIIESFVTSGLFQALFGIMAAICGLWFILSQIKPPKEGEFHLQLMPMLRAHYWKLMLAIGGLAAACAIWFYLFEIAGAVDGLVDRLEDELAGDAKPENLRNLAQGTALLLGALAFAGTLIFQLIKVWITERVTVATEEGLVTDRINKAIEGLGAEKTTTRIGRVITIEYQKEVTEFLETSGEIQAPKGYRQSGDMHAALKTFGDPKDPEEPSLGDRQAFEPIKPTDTIIHWQGEPEPSPPYSSVETTGNWEAFNETRPNMEVRIGAILALERIAKNNPEVHIQIMEMLCAYLRENAPADRAPSSPPIFPTIPRTDLQLVINVFRRRSSTQRVIERAAKHRLDLRRTNLAFFDFGRGDWSAVLFREAYLVGTNFEACDLTGTDFYKSEINYANFRGATLRGTRMDFVNNNCKAALPLNLANFQGVTFIGANLQGLDFLGKAKAIRDTFGTSDTQLSPEVEQIRPKMKHLPHLERYERGEDTKFAKDIEAIKASGFENWLPFGASDMAVGHYLTKFKQARGLTGFPFDN